MTKSLTLSDILAAAETTLRESGAAALSMRSVARAANVAHSGLYNYVSNREELLALLAERMWHDHVRQLRGSADPSAGQAVDTLISVIRRDPAMANLLRELLGSDQSPLGATGRVAAAVYPRFEHLNTVGQALVQTAVTGLLAQGPTLQVLDDDQARDLGERVLVLIRGECLPDCVTLSACPGRPSRSPRSPT